jgi:hypothetical protein
MAALLDTRTNFMHVVHGGIICDITLFFRKGNMGSYRFDLLVCSFLCSPHRCSFLFLLSISTSHPPFLRERLFIVALFLSLAPEENRTKDKGQFISTIVNNKDNIISNEKSKCDRKKNGSLTQTIDYYW